MGNLCRGEQEQESGSSVAPPLSFAHRGLTVIYTLASAIMTPITIDCTHPIRRLIARMTVRSDTAQAQGVVLIWFVNGGGARLIAICEGVPPGCVWLWGSVYVGGG